MWKNYYIATAQYVCYVWWSCPMMRGVILLILRQFTPWKMFRIVYRPFLQLFQIVLYLWLPWFMAHGSWPMVDDLWLWKLKMQRNTTFKFRFQYPFQRFVGGCQWCDRQESIRYLLKPLINYNLNKVLNKGCQPSSGNSYLIFFFCVTGNGLTIPFFIMLRKYNRNSHLSIESVSVFRFQMCRTAYKNMYLVTYKLRFYTSTDYTLSILDPVHYLLVYTVTIQGNDNYKKRRETRKKKTTKQKLKLNKDWNCKLNATKEITQNIKHRCMVGSADERQSRQNNSKNDACENIVFKRIIIMT